MTIRFRSLDFAEAKRFCFRRPIASVSLMVLLVLSLAPYVSSLKPINAQTDNDNCEKRPVAKVGANGARGAKTAAMAVDDDPATRWANQAVGSFIQLDLGKSQVLCDIDIAWYRGNVRSYNFVISTSENGVNFKDIASAASSGKTTSLERYNIPDQTARYVRITVHGNTQNDLGSITEMAVLGRSTAQEQEQDCTIPRITGVSANGNDGHLPQNTLDNNANTRWSNFGFPSWIQYDLGSKSQPICDVDIAWYRGNLRVNTFEISSSDDGENFVPIFIGKSSGKTTSPEKYDVQDTEAKYIRITVDENSETDWASITEVDINGGSQTPVPTPKEICGNGVDDDKDGQIDEGCTPGGGGGGSGQTDTFGIQKIYPTKANGEEWFMDMTDGQDDRSRPPSMTKNTDDGSFKVKSGQVRYGVFTTSGYRPNEVELNHGILAQRGYMQSNNDWKNVEMTGYVKVNSGQSGENFAWYARGGRHTGSGNPEGCEGVAYKPALFYDGRVRFAKEQWHVSYAFTDSKKAMDLAEEEWVGFKGIMWNTVQNGKTVVKMEIWLDKNVDGKEDGPWEKVDENIDSGGWGSEGEECGGASDQIITWGGPIATFRWDGASDVDIKNFSVREIQPPQ
jgi:F5/8 type C domain